MNELTLSLFPGLGLMDRAFEEQNFCVVRGPDLLWGGEIKLFHPPRGRFDGIIGGPPCKLFSPIANVVRAKYGPAALAENLIPEFERVVCEAQPRWFVMENVPRAPLPCVEGYAVSNLVLNARGFGMEQNRARRFSFGVCGMKNISLLPYIDFVLFEHPQFEPTVTASHGGGLYRQKGGRMKTKRAIEMIKRAAKRTVPDYLRLQGLPPDFFERIQRALKLDGALFTVTGAKSVIGNGVPLSLGRAVAKALRAIVDGME